MGALSKTALNDTAGNINESLMPPHNPLALSLDTEWNTYVFDDLGHCYHCYLQLLTNDGRHTQCSKKGEP